MITVLNEDKYLSDGIFLNRSWSRTMTIISTHVLNTSIGKPAEGIPLELSILQGNEWKVLSSAVTNTDGRTGDLLNSVSESRTGTFKIQFQMKAYLEKAHGQVFYPWIDVVLNIEEENVKYHIPILISPFGYSTYRGS